MKSAEEELSKLKQSEKFLKREVDAVQKEYAAKLDTLMGEIKHLEENISKKDKEFREVVEENSANKRILKEANRRVCALECLKDKQEKDISDLKKNYECKLRESLVERDHIIGKAEALERDLKEKLKNSEGKISELEENIEAWDIFRLNVRYKLAEIHEECKAKESFDKNFGDEESKNSNQQEKITSLCEVTEFKTNINPFTSK